MYLENILSGGFSVVHLGGIFQKGWRGFLGDAYSKVANFFYFRGVFGKRDDAYAPHAKGRTRAGGLGATTFSLRLLCPPDPKFATNCEGVHLRLKCNPCKPQWKSILHP